MAQFNRSNYFESMNSNSSSAQPFANVASPARLRNAHLTQPAIPSSLLALTSPARPEREIPLLARLTSKSSSTKLSIRVDQPVEGCFAKAHAYLRGESGTDIHSLQFQFRWLRSSFVSSCSNPTCNLDLEAQKSAKKIQCICCSRSSE